jgi:hypothetical protein
MIQNGKMNKLRERNHVILISIDCDIYTNSFLAKKENEEEGDEVGEEGDNNGEEEGHEENEKSGDDDQPPQAGPSRRMSGKPPSSGKPVTRGRGRGRGSRGGSKK